MFGHQICLIETGRTTGRRVDAAGDGRAPGAIAFPPRRQALGDSSLINAITCLLSSRLLTTLAF